jgi:hypothetical protein
MDSLGYASRPVMAPSETGRTGGHVTAGEADAVTMSVATGSVRDGVGVAVALGPVQAKLSATRA